MTKENEEMKQASGQKLKKEESGREGKKSKELQKQIDELKEQAKKDKDDYLKLMAEFETFRRRSAEDRLNLVSMAAADTIKGLLPTLDDCERAMAMLEENGDPVAKEGTALIYGKLLSYLQGKGLKAIEARGEEFDTDFHEAVTRFPVDDPEKKGRVIDVVQTGYTLNGKVIRYAKVVVGA
ncbi:MAG: nucleotide exchange factor GrpE [Bacteroidales bacterium]|nr:nucleotide exchange factor GrpE [Bacteroidales bacterium]